MGLWQATKDLGGGLLRLLVFWRQSEERAAQRLESLYDKQLTLLQKRLDRARNDVEKTQAEAEIRTTEDRFLDDLRHLTSELATRVIDRRAPRGPLPAAPAALPPPHEPGLESALEVAALLAPPTDADEHFLRGNAYYTAGDYEKALDSYNRALELRPDDPSTLTNLGVTLSELERNDEAFAACNRALELRPNDPDTLLNRGATLGELERYAEALVDLDRSLELRPNDPTTLYNRGNALDRMGRHDEALAAYNRSLELRADDPNTLYNRGLALENLGRQEEALADYSRALDIRPGDAATMNNRGIVLSNLGRAEEARADYSRSLELRPDDAKTIMNRGVTLYDLERYEDALADYNRSLELRPDHPPTYYNRARVYSRLENAYEAFEDLRRAIAGDPANRELARTDEDFANIRDGQRFRELVGEDEPPSKDSAGSE